MRFAIAYHTEEKKRFLIIAELVGEAGDFEQWKISPKDAREKFVLVQSDRPKQLKTNRIAERFNWTIVASKTPVTEKHLTQIIRMIEWRIFFELNPGYAGVFPKDAFSLDPLNAEK